MPQGACWRGSERWTMMSSRRGWSGRLPCRPRAIPCPYHAGPYPADSRDARFDALCALCLEANELQRAQIPEIFAWEEGTRAYTRIADWSASRERAGNDLSSMMLYMCRVTSSIGSSDDARRLRRGLAAGAILQERRTTATASSRSPSSTRPRGDRRWTPNPSSWKWRGSPGPRRGLCAAS